MVMIMASGGIDLSIGAMAGLAAIIVAQSSWGGMPVGAAFFLAMFVALMVGVINGLLVGAARIHAAVVTLGMMALLQGISYALFSAASSAPLTVDAEPFLQTLAESPISWILLILQILVIFALLQFTPFGRRPRPGDERESWLARSFFVGSPYVLSSIAASYAGVLLLARIRAAMMGIGSGLEVDVILASVLGGAVLGGGFGNVITAILGTAAVALLRNVALLTQIRHEIPANAIMIVKGALMLVVALMAHLYYKGVGWAFGRAKARKAAEEAAGTESTNSG
jgi:ribose/xylose/arabinose/galactoside ABC-type transport system permease subunit